MIHLHEMNFTRCRQVPHPKSAFSGRIAKDESRPARSYWNASTMQTCRGFSTTCSCHKISTKAEEFHFDLLSLYHFSKKKMDAATILIILQISDTTCDISLGPPWLAFNPIIRLYFNPSSKARKRGFPSGSDPPRRSENFLNSKLSPSPLNLWSDIRHQVG